MNSKLRIAMKLKEWKEIIRKLNTEEERKRLSKDELVTLVICMQKIEEEILHLQKKFDYKHQDYINFFELKKEFFKNLKR